MSTTAAPSADKNAAFSRRLFNGRTTRFSTYLFLLISLVLASAASPTSVKARAEHIKITFTESYPFEFFNMCTGEDVSGVQTVTSTVHMTVDGTGVFHFNIHTRVHGTAVGATSGIQYIYSEASHQTNHENHTGALQDTITINAEYVSQGSADNFVISSLSHLTINANGDVTSEFFTLSEECRG